MTSQVFDYGDKPFLTWMEFNPAGFVLNTSKSSGSADHMLHRSRCGHLTGLVGDQGPDGYTMKDYIKVCTHEPVDLMKWYIENRPIKNGITNLCKDCFKDQDFMEDVWLEIIPHDLLEIEVKPPARVPQMTSRIKRNYRLSDSLKVLYSFSCQICGVSISLPGNQSYTEAHHIKPLGIPHNGPDIEKNLICVCPNHHVQLDYAAIPLATKDLTIHQNHQIGEEYIEFHNWRVQRMSAV